MKHGDAWNRWLGRIGHALARSLFPRANPRVIDVGPRPERQKNSARQRNARSGWHVVPDAKHGSPGK
jgi:hypothetical protein